MEYIFGICGTSPAWVRNIFLHLWGSIQRGANQSLFAKLFWFILFYDIFKLMELGPKKNEKKLRCGVLDEVVEQKGALPPSKSSIGSKKSAQKKYD